MTDDRSRLPELDPDLARAMIGGMLGVAQVADGPTDEQRRVIRALSAGLWSIDPSSLDPLEPAELRALLGTSGLRRRFVQTAIIVQFCRHPNTPAQEARLEEYAVSLDIDGPELRALHDWAHEDAQHATADYVRNYDRFLPELSEPRPFTVDDDDVLPEVRALAELPADSLGRALLDFYERNRLTPPGPNTPAPAYYVSHDLNHVIAGYETSGPEEIALGAFKLAMHDSEANWMAFMTNLLIHEAGLLKHGKVAGEQFVPYGGEIYPDADGEGALHLANAPEILAEAIRRGSASTSDVTEIDHLAIAHRPLAEIRAEHGIPARLIR